MCGFLSVFTEDENIKNYYNDNIDDLFKLIKRRGPSEVKTTIGKNYFISHALLAINDHVTQPVEDNNLLLYMNGEIYNPEALSSKNDTEWLLEFFNKNSDMSTLDGEFIIVCYDKKKNIITIASDPFATKPCFYLCVPDKLLTLSSYQEPLIKMFGAESIREFPPNTLAKINLDDYSIIETSTIVNWDFTPRCVDFDSWNKAFYNSIKKRTSTDKKIFLGLSSGYDSGLIVSSLLKLEKQFDSYSIYGAENKDILDERVKIVNNSNLNVNAYIVQYNQNRYDKHLAFIKENSSNYPYRDVNGRFIKWMLDDKAAVGLSMICEDAKKRNAPIYFSGQGADEIFSDYKTRGPHHGTIRGNFTNVRNKWTNFDMGFQRNFLSKEERIPGAWGIEARYPFLDRDVVQNFLWLEDHIKNSEYKQCIAQLLRKHSFPFKQNEKRGFNPLVSLPKGKKMYSGR